MRPRIIRQSLLPYAASVRNGKNYRQRIDYKAANAIFMEQFLVMYEALLHLQTFRANSEMDKRLRNNFRISLFSSVAWLKGTLRAGLDTKVELIHEVLLNAVRGQRGLDATRVALNRCHPGSVRVRPRLRECLPTTCTTRHSWNATADSCFRRRIFADKVVRDWRETGGRIEPKRGIERRPVDGLQGLKGKFRIRTMGRGRYASELSHHRDCTNNQVNSSIIVAEFLTVGRWRNSKGEKPATRFFVHSYLWVQWMSLWWRTFAGKLLYFWIFLLMV